MERNLNWQKIESALLHVPLLVIGLLRRRMPCFCLFILFLTGNPNSYADPVVKSSVDSFKSFLSSRPIVEEVLFRRLEYVPSKAGTQPIESFYYGAWQSNAFFFRQIANPNRPTAPIGKGNDTMGRMFVGRNNNKYWQINHTNIFYWLDSEEPAPSRKTNAYFAAAVSGEMRLAQILNMGLWSITNGSLIWDGNSFKASQDYRLTSAPRLYDPKTKQPLVDVWGTYGDLLTAGNQVQGLMLRNIERAEPSEFIEYAFNTNIHLPYGLPSLMNVSRLLPPNWEKKQLVDTFEILLLKIAEKALPSEYFGPERFVDSQFSSSLLYSNKSLFLQKNGKLEYAYTALEMQKISLMRHPGAPTAKKGLVLAVFASTVALAIIFFFRLKKETKKNKPLEEHNKQKST